MSTDADPIRHLLRTRVVARPGPGCWLGLVVRAFPLSRRPQAETPPEAPRPEPSPKPGPRPDPAPRPQRLPGTPHYPGPTPGPPAPPAPVPTGVPGTSPLDAPPISPAIGAVIGSTDGSTIGSTEAARLDVAARSARAATPGPQAPRGAPDENPQPGTPPGTPAEVPPPGTPTEVPQPAVPAETPRPAAPAEIPPSTTPVEVPPPTGPAEIPPATTPVEAPPTGPTGARPDHWLVAAWRPDRDGLHARFPEFAAIASPDAGRALAELVAHLPADARVCLVTPERVDAALVARMVLAVDRNLQPWHREGLREFIRARDQADARAIAQRYTDREEGFERVRRSLGLPQR